MALEMAFALWWCILQLNWVIISSTEHCTEEWCAEGVEKPIIFKANGSAPGFRAIITSNGLNYLNRLVIPLLNKELIKLEIPEISGKADVKVAKVKYKFKNIHLTESYIGMSSLETDSKMGLTFKAADINLKVEGDWSYKTWAASDHGSVKIKADGISLTVSILLGANQEGQPSLVSTSCSFRVGGVSVKFKGGASWLLNLFNNKVEKKIRDALNSKVCDLVSDNIKKSVNKALVSFPVTVPIDKVAKLSYALIDKPSFTSWLVMTDHKGEFFSADSTQTTTGIPFPPSPLPSLPPSAESDCRMMYLWVTDYVANTAALLYTRAGLLKYNVTPDVVGDSGSLFKLDTSTFSQMIPKLYDKYPNKPVILGVRSIDNPPTLKITSQGAKLIVPSALDLFVIDDTNEILAFTLGIMVSLDIQAWIEGGSNDNQLFLKANATYIDAELSVLTSNIGDIGEKAIKNVWNAVSVLCQMFLMPPINRFTNKGFPVPMVKGVTFVNPLLTLGEGYVLIETDISYEK